MKNKILIISSFLMVSVFSANVYAAGQNNNAEMGVQVQQQIHVTTENENSQAKDKSDNEKDIQTQQETQIVNQGEDNQIQNQNGNGNKVQDQDQEQQEQTNGEQNRSVVANFVQSLLSVAEREKDGIGEQVRAIAQQQNQSLSVTVQAMEKVQTKSKIQTFLFGSDYRNLGVLRSEIVQTRNRLLEAEKLMENVQSEGDKTDLQNQIQTLEQEQTKIENFIKTQEGKFSLFGWLVKMFQ